MAAAGIISAASEQALPGGQRVVRHLANVQGRNGAADDSTRARKFVSKDTNIYDWRFQCASHDIQYDEDPECNGLDPRSGSVVLHTRLDVQIAPDSVSGESGGATSVRFKGLCLEAYGFMHAIDSVGLCWSVYGLHRAWPMLHGC